MHRTAFAPLGSNNNKTADWQTAQEQQVLIVENQKEEAQYITIRQTPVLSLILHSLQLDTLQGLHETQPGTHSPTKNVYAQTTPSCRVLHAAV
jgi:hypothetical protein